MTVSKVVGSSLDEVWGAYDSAPITQKKKKKQPMPKVDNIMDNYYDKTKWSRTQFPLDETDDSDAPRESVDKYVKLISRNEGLREHYDESHTPKISNNHVAPTNDDKEAMYLDLALYVFSGIILIFIMEQFINIGMALK
jgi:hypothetical protein